MRLKEITAPIDVAKLLKLDFDSEFMSCTKGEWVQFLQKLAMIDKFLLLGKFDDNGDIVDYLLAAEAIVPPIVKEVRISYVNKKYTQAMSEKVIEWARERGANKIAIITDKENTYNIKGMGYRHIGNLMEIEID
jgi:hypothetical protein